MHHKPSYQKFLSDNRQALEELYKQEEKKEKKKTYDQFCMFMYILHRQEFGEIVTEDIQTF